MAGLVEGADGHEGDGAAEGRGEGEAQDQQGEGHLSATEAVLAVSPLRFDDFHESACSMAMPYRKCIVMV